MNGATGRRLIHNSRHCARPASPAGPANQHRRRRHKPGAVLPIRFPASIQPRSTRPAPSSWKSSCEFHGIRAADHVGLLHFFDKMPNLDIEILRDQAKIYNVSEAKIGSLLRNGYSPELRLSDQEAERSISGDRRSRRIKDRDGPPDLSKLYVRSDDGLRLVPLNAVVKWKQSVGPQSVNHLNQFTSVSYLLQSKARRAAGRRDRLHSESRRRDAAASPSAASFRAKRWNSNNTVSSLTILMLVAVFVMYVVLGILYESYLHPITVLSSLPVALVGGLATLCAVPRTSVALRLHRHVHADGHRQEKRHHDRRLRHATGGTRSSPPRRQSTTPAWTVSARSS